MRRLVVGLLVVLVLLVGADRFTAWLAARAVAVSAERSEHLAQRPHVTLGGFPFLTQLARGRYDDVHLVVDDFTTPDAVTLQTVDVRLHGVHLSAGAAVRRKVTSVPVDSGQVSARLSYAALGSAVAPRLPSFLTASFSPEKGSSTAVSTSLRYTGIGVPLTLAGAVGVSLVGQTLHIQLLPGTLTAGGSSLLDAVRSAVAKALSVDLTLPRLPFGATIDGAHADDEGVTVAASATSFVLQPN
jgi:hypothetical protein